MNSISKENKYSERNPWVAGFLNFLLPGLGYFYCGEFKFGIFVGIFSPAMYIVAYFIAILLPVKFNAILQSISFIIIPLIFSIHCIFIANKKKQYQLKWLNKEFFYIIFFILGSWNRSVWVDAYFLSFTKSNKSMENTILTDEQVFINMNYFGIYNPLTKNKLTNSNSPDAGSIILYKTASIDTNNSGVYFSINRIVGTPGDTIKIEFTTCYINNIQEKRNINYEYDNYLRMEPNDNIYPKGASWNEDNYGPLYIPKKGDVISLNDSNIIYWSQLIEKEIDNTESINEIIKLGKYKIKYNYYFALGDNRNNAADSRYKGLIKEEEIIGKPEFITINFKNLWNIFSEKSRVGIKIE